MFLLKSVFSVITTLLATKLYQGLIFNGIWHTKLKVNFNKLVTQSSSKGAAAKIVQYYTQNNSINYISCINMSKIILGSNDEVYNILTKNWFGQTWTGMGNWYYMGHHWVNVLNYMSHWVNVLNIREKKFFQNLNTFVLKII